MSVRELRQGDAEYPRQLLRVEVDVQLATGRLTGGPRRIEIVFHNLDGRIYISGMPRADRVNSFSPRLSSKLLNWALIVGGARRNCSLARPMLPALTTVQK